MTVDKRGLEYKIIDLGLKNSVTKKLQKNMKNIYIHKYKINILRWPPVALGIKSWHDLASLPISLISQICLFARC